MGKIKVLFIVLSIFLLGAIVAGIFFLWPFLAKFWNEMVVPNKAIFTCGEFALVMLWLATRKWPMWLKIILGTAVLSGASTLSGIGLVDISGQIFYQATLAIFLVISFTVMLWRKSRKHGNEDEDASEAKKAKKPLGKSLKQKWNDFVVRIAGKDKNGGKKIALYTIGAIVGGVLAFPLVVQLFEPLWSHVIVPGRDYMLVIGLIGLIIGMTLVIKNIIIKTIIYGLALAGISLIYGTEVPNILTDSWFQFTTALFVCSLIFAIPFWSEEFSRNREGRCTIGALLSFVAIIVATIFVFKFGIVGPIIMLAFFIIVGLSALSGADGDEDGNVTFMSFALVITIIIMSCVIFVGDKDSEFVKNRSAKALAAAQVIKVEVEKVKTGLSRLPLENEEVAVCAEPEVKPEQAPKPEVIEPVKTEVVPVKTENKEYEDLMLSPICFSRDYELASEEVISLNGYYKASYWAMKELGTLRIPRKIHVVKTKEMISVSFHKNENMSQWGDPWSATYKANAAALFTPDGIINIPDGAPISCNGSNSAGMDFCITIK